MSEYSITDRNGDYAGTLVYEIRARQTDGGRETWAISRVIDSLGDRETVEVVVGIDGFRPQTSSLVRTNDQGRQSATTVYSGSQVDIELTSVQDVVTPERMNVPSDVRDRRTLVMLARAFALDEGYRTRINTFLPIAALIERARVAVGEEETIDSLTGPVRTRRVDFVMQRSEITVWLDVDAPHAVVKFTDSRNGGTYELVRYEPN